MIVCMDSLYGCIQLPSNVYVNKNMYVRYIAKHRVKRVPAEGGRDS